MPFFKSFFITFLALPAILAKPAEFEPVPAPPGEDTDPDSVIWAAPYLTCYASRAFQGDKKIPDSSDLDGVLTANVCYYIGYFFPNTTKYDPDTRMCNRLDGRSENVTYWSARCNVMAGQGFYFLNNKSGRPDMGTAAIRAEKAGGAGFNKTKTGN